MVAATALAGDADAGGAGGPPLPRVIMPPATAAPLDLARGRQLPAGAALFAAGVGDRHHRRLARFTPSAMSETMCRRLSSLTQHSERTDRAVALPFGREGRVAERSADHCEPPQMIHQNSPRRSPRAGLVLTVIITANLAPKPRLMAPGERAPECVRL